MIPVQELFIENAFNFSVSICCCLFLRQSVYILLFLFLSISLHRKSTLEDAVWISIWRDECMHSISIACCFVEVLSPLSLDVIDCCLRTECDDVGSLKLILILIVLSTLDNISCTDIVVLLFHDER